MSVEGRSVHVLHNSGYGPPPETFRTSCVGTSLHLDLGAALLAYGSQGLLGPYLKGKFAALKGIPAILRKRSRVQSGQLASTRDLWQAMDGNWIRRKRVEKRFDFRK